MSFLMTFLYKINCCVEEHLKHLRAVFTILREHKLYAKLSKYEFGQPQIDSWGHIISGEGLAVDPSEIESMTPWPTPTSVKPPSSSRPGTASLPAIYLSLRLR